MRELKFPIRVGTEVSAIYNRLQMAVIPAGFMTEPGRKRMAGWLPAVAETRWKEQWMRKK